MFVAIDYETHPISKDAPFPKPVCLSYHDGKNTGLITGMDQMGEFLATLLKGVVWGTKHLIAHNIVFEAGVTYYHFPELRPLLFDALKKKRVFCTKISEEIINVTRKSPIQKFALSDLVKNYFNEDITSTKTDPDAWRLRYNELEHFPVSEWPIEAIKYAQDDSIWAYRLHKEQQKSSPKASESVRAAILLNLMGIFGIRVDVQRAQDLEDEIYRMLTPKYQQLISLGLCEAVKGKIRPKKKVGKLRELIEKTVTSPVYSAKNCVKTDGESLAAYYLQTGNEVFKLFGDLATYDKVLTSYLNNLKVPLIRSNYETVKSTGRTSSFGSKLYPAVNIQQIPRTVPGVQWDVRNCFIPREGFKIVSIDYSGLELASTANQLGLVFGKSKMLDTINGGDSPVDMHSKLACKIMYIKQKQIITLEEFIKRKKEPELAQFRQLSKPINLGFPGGLGYDTMRHLLALEGIKTKFVVIFSSANEKEVRNYWYKLKSDDENVRVARIGPKKWALVYDELVGFKKALFSLYPELEWFLKERHKQYMTGETKYVKNDWGEWETEEMYNYDIYGFKREWCTYTAFCNGFLMQTPSAIGAKRMASDIIEKYLPDPDMNPLAFIHDEMLFEVREGRYDIVEDVAEMMIDGMQSVLTKVRISVEAEVMDYWKKSGGFWSKTYWKDPNSSILRSQ